MCEGSEMERGGGNTSLCESGAGLPVELCRCEWDFFFFFRISWSNEIAVMLEVTA